jgi:hypothetical protein
MSRHVWFVSAIVLAFAMLAAAQTPPPVTKPASNTYSQMKNEVTAKGTIEAIAADRRAVTVKFESGYSEVVSVSPEVKRFNEVKVGDKVNLRYYEAVVLYVRKAGDTSPAPPESSDKSSATPGGGEHPGGTAARQRKMTVTVVSIDKATPSITVKTPEGETVTRKLQDAKNLEGVSLGDKIDITYTEAMLVGVEPTT